MGMSRGGEAAYSVALAAMRRRMRATDIRFAAHIVIAPGGCNFPQRDVRTTGAPIFFMLGEHDDVHLATTCADYVRRMRDAGNRNMRLAVYPGVHHSYEWIGGIAYLPKDWASRHCAGLFYRDEGMLLYHRGSGKRATRSDQTDYLFKKCLVEGHHVGGDQRVKAQATADLLQFLREVDIIADREARAVVPDCTTVPDGIYRLNCTRARAGWTGDLVALGRFYHRHAGDGRNDQLAARLFKLAADRGHPHGQWELSLLYRNGMGVPRDDKAALSLARAAADSEDPTALNILGVMARDGIGQKRDDAEAVRWFAQIRRPPQ